MGAGDRLERAPAGIVITIARPQRIGFVTPHRPQAARIKVFEKGQTVGTAVAVAVADLTAERPRQPGREREISDAPVIQFIKFRRAARQGDLRRELVQAAAGRKNSPVAGIVRPTAIQLELVVGITVLAQIIHHFGRGVFLGVEPDVLVAGAEAQRIEFVQRKAEIDLAAVNVLGVVGGVELGAVDGPVEQPETEADAVQRIIWIVKGNVVVLADVAVVEDDAQLIAGPQKVVLGQAGVEQQTRLLAVTDAEHHAVGGAFDDRVVHVHLIVGAGHGGRFDVDAFQVIQTLQAGLGAFEILARDPAALGLSQLPAQHFILRFAVALKVDAAHVDPPAWIDREIDRDFFVFVVQARHGVDVGEGVALLAQALAHFLGDLGHLGAGKGVPLLDGDQLAQVLLRDDAEVARQGHIFQGVTLAFIDVDGDVHILLVRGDRDLGRFDVELEVTPIQVERAQAFDVGRQFLLGILIVLGEKREPAAGGRLQLFQKLLLAERLVTDDVDPVDAGHRAFRDVDGDRHPVTLQRLHLALDLNPVAAPAVILLQQFLFDFIQQRPVEHPAFRQPDAGQRLFQVLGADVPVAGQADLGDGRPFGHGHHQHVALALQIDVREETGAKQRPDDLGIILLRNGRTDLNGQIVEHRAGGNPLQALDLDVLHDELRGARAGGRDPQAGGEQQTAIRFHERVVSPRTRTAGPTLTDG